MDLNATIDLIIKDLDEAQEIIDDLKKYQGVPALQVELAKSKCKSAGEVIALLKSVRYDIPLVKEEAIQQQERTPPPAEKKTPVIPVNLITQPEVKKKEIKQVEMIAPPIVKKEESKKVSKKVQKSTIIADKFSYMSNSFNEQLGSMKSNDDVSDILKTKPLTNLSEAIGVNDKFLFIREIFNGNKDAYTQAISRLDKINSLTDARAVIMSFTGDSNENEAFKQLIDLVKRKLSSNE